MKIKVPVITEEDIRLVRISAAVNYGEEEMPNDFPGRLGNTWKAEVEIDTGRIVNWPKGRAEEVVLTVKDSGTYALVNVAGEEVALIEEYYVPNEVIPGCYGDTIELSINADGVITNWPKNPNVDWFFPED
jgi:hypothetical protein